jgi:hypothetical protein
MEEKDIAKKLKGEFNVKDFLNNLFTLRQVSVLYHLNITGPGSYAKHKASNKLYESLTNNIDNFIESYQGKYGIIKNLTIDKAVLDENFISYVKRIAVYVESSQSKFKESWLQNQVDEISTLLYGILYKLENLS